jgi:hypothetical protein
LVEGDGKQSAVTSDSFYGYEGAASADHDQQAQALSRFITRHARRKAIGQGNGVTSATSIGEVWPSVADGDCE